MRKSIESSQKNTYKIDTKRILTVIILCANIASEHYKVDSIKANPMKVGDAKLWI